MSTSKFVSVSCLCPAFPLTHVRGSEYIYSSHLMTVDTCKPAVGEYSLKDKLPHHSLLKEDFWSQEFASHTDRYYIAYLFEGTTNRSRIGFNRRCSLYSCTDNMPINNLTIVSEYIPTVGSAVRKNVQALIVFSI